MQYYVSRILKCQKTFRPMCASSLAEKTHLPLSLLVMKKWLICSYPVGVSSVERIIKNECGQ